MLREILTQLGTTAIIIGIAGWLSKTWITHQLERLRTQNSHDLALKLEEARAVWAKDVARLNVHESYLHKRRVELIEEMYREMVDAEFSLQNFLVSWWAHSNKQELVERGFLPQENSPEERIESMEKSGLAFCEEFLKINAMLHRNALFFEDSLIEDIRREYDPFFNSILSLDYENVSSMPDMPDEFKSVVTVGQAPRRAVTGRFRALLGVAFEGEPS